MSSANGPYVITYDGEVYNYLELRRELESLNHAFRSGTDTEVILNAYAQWGNASLQRFNGMWAFAIYDRVKRIVFCARDRFGVKPFYYANTVACRNSRGWKSRAPIFQCYCASKTRARWHTR